MLIDNAFRADTRNLTPETKSHALIYLAALRQRKNWSLKPAFQMASFHREGPRPRGPRTAGTPSLPTSD